MEHFQDEGTHFETLGGARTTLLDALTVITRGRVSVTQECVLQELQHLLRVHLLQQPVEPAGRTKKTTADRSTGDRLLGAE